jgi:hypothetical protein
MRSSLCISPLALLTTISAISRTASKLPSINGLENPLFQQL